MATRKSTQTLAGLTSQVTEGMLAQVTSYVKQAQELKGVKYIDCQPYNIHKATGTPAESYPDTVVYKMMSLYNSVMKFVVVAVRVVDEEHDLDRLELLTQPNNINSRTVWTPKEIAEDSDNQWETLASGGFFDIQTLTALARNLEKYTGIPLVVEELPDEPKPVKEEDVFVVTMTNISDDLESAEWTDCKVTSTLAKAQEIMQTWKNNEINAAEDEGKTDITIEDENDTSVLLLWDHGNEGCKMEIHKEKITH
jgi:hypothetical protein